ncbi:MAG: hypothetical protein IJM76_05815 [Lachnospiraceae bacterium]|nr:hypothetical protein [Lachnospiraceae bacterium]
MTLYELWRVADALISIVDEDGNPVRNYDGEDYGKKRTVGTVGVADSLTIWVELES